jgi:cysteinyl-tRNA synthetase
LLNFDRIFGLNLEKVRRIKIPQKIKKLVKIREEYRKKGDFEKADEIREKIKEMGYWVEDTKEGPRIKKFKK